MTQEYTRTYRTEDGYTFYLLSDGTVVDNLEANNVDMSWDSLEKFVWDIRVLGGIVLTSQDRRQS